MNHKLQIRVCARRHGEIRQEEGMKKRTRWLAKRNAATHLITHSEREVLITSCVSSRELRVALECVKMPVRCPSFRCRPSASPCRIQTSHRPGLHYTASRRARTRLQSLRRDQGAANRFLQTIYLMAIFSQPIRQPSSTGAINTCCAQPAHISGFQAARENTDAPSPSS